MGFLQPLCFSFHLLNPHCSFADARFAMLKYIRWYPGPDSLKSMLARGNKSSCALYWFILDYIIIFPSQAFISLDTFPFYNNIGIQWTHQCLCHLTNFLRYSSWLILIYKGNLLQSMRFCSFWARPPFCHSSCVVSFRVICWMCSILQLIYSSFTFLFQHVITLEMSHLQHSSAPCNFLFLMWLLLQITHLFWPFVFRLLAFFNQSVHSSWTIFSTYITTSDWLQDLMQHAILDLSE